MLAEQNSHIVAVQQELQQLRQLADSQARQLKRLQGQTASGAAPGEESPSTGATQESSVLSELMPSPERIAKIKQKGLF